MIFPNVFSVYLHSFQLNTIEMFHTFKKTVKGIILPDKFTYPFCYVPHELCIIAADEVKSFLAGNRELYDDARNGKMFGVLVVRKNDGTTGFLAAFSGLLAGKSRTDYFVPPVFDLTDPEGFFKEEESLISAINSRIDAISGSCRFNSCMQRLYNTESNAVKQLKMEKEKMKFSKHMRDERRRAGVTDEEEKEMIRQSQFQKAEYKRIEKKLKEDILSARAEVESINRELDDLKKERRKRSATLQNRIFQHFVMINALGERRNLIDIFHDFGIELPPSGSGECAAPKLLQYAYLNGMTPVAMAEFWIGRSPVSEIRTDGNFYPSCTGKCGPILNFMLKGLEVEDNPVALEASKEYSPEIIYEDSAIVVVDKPSGMLTVPGNIAAKSLYDFVLSRYRDICGPAIVHRLDMATSGIVVFARNKDVHEFLQKQFACRAVVKRYIALVDGIPENDKGVINLPLCPDIENRPRQMVNFDYGKPSVTQFRVIERTIDGARVEFTPITGRTHQLRVHSANIGGLGCPIKGDSLYGTKSDRLYLHASYISFVHPLTGNTVSFESSPAF